jgi:hypothetical protein
VEANPEKPPAIVRFLIILLMLGSSGDAVLGDLQERSIRIARDPEQSALCGARLSSS